MGITSTYNRYRHLSLTSLSLLFAGFEPSVFPYRKHTALRSLGYLPFFNIPFSSVLGLRSMSSATAFEFIHSVSSLSSAAAWRN